MGFAIPGFALSISPRRDLAFFVFLLFCCILRVFQKKPGALSAGLHLRLAVVCFIEGRDQKWSAWKEAWVERD
jgi:hypothetical protein